MRDAEEFGIILASSVIAEREVEHPNREYKKHFAPCAIGLPFAGMFDPVAQGVFHGVEPMSKKHTAGKTATNNGRDVRAASKNGLQRAVVEAAAKKPTARKAATNTRTREKSIAREMARTMREAAKDRNAKRNPDAPRRFIGWGLDRRELFDVRLELSAKSAAFIRATSNQKTTAAALAYWAEAALREAADRYFAARPEEEARILAADADGNAATA